jgi:hypothetical protein
VCFNCLQPGHSACECPTRINRVLGATASESVELAQPHQQVHFKFVVQPNAVDAPTVLIGQLDSASPVHITSLETARLTRAKVNQAETMYNLVGVNNRPLSVIGVIHLTVSFGAEPHNIEVVVVDGAENQVLFSQQRLGSLGHTLYKSSPQGQELTIVGTAYAQAPGQGCWMPAVVRPYKMNHCLTVPEDPMTEDELVSDRIRDQTREFQRPRSNKTYLVRSAIEDAREEDEVDRWRKLAQGAVLMLKRIEKDTQIDELTRVWTVLRKPGGYPEFPVFPWPGSPGYKRLIPSVECREGF